MVIVRVVNVHATRLQVIISRTTEKIICYLPIYIPFSSDRLAINNDQNSLSKKISELK